MTQPKYTNAQLTLIQELCLAHALQPDQISFDGQDITPIFDYEAACSLSLKLTDIAEIKTTVLPLDPMDHLRSRATCTIILTDGRSRSVEDSAEIGEQLGNGVVVQTRREAEGMAQNRAVRRGIRSVGVNLYNAHKHFVESGEITVSHTRHDPRATTYAEIHILAEKVGLIVDGERNGYEQFIAESFAGRTSAKDLNDIELRLLLVNLRTMANLVAGTKAA